MAFSADAVVYYSILLLPASAGSLESCPQIAEICRSTQQCREWQLFCLALLCLMEKFLMPDAITEPHVRKEPGPCASFFRVVLTLVVYQTASVATKVGWYCLLVKLTGGTR